MVRVAVASDVHLEFGGRDFALPDADILLLAGDILVVDDLQPTYDYTKRGRDAREFIRDVSAKYPQVVYIPGNHEMYSGNISTTSEKVDYFLKQEGIKNIEFSEFGSHIVDDVKIIYATLWTDINKGNPIDVMAGANSMNDYREIMISLEGGSGGRYLRPEDTMKIHDIHRKHIMKELDTGWSDKLIVMTHHSPSVVTSNGYYGGDRDSLYYCNDMDEIILDNEKIKYWIHGHTHTRHETELGKTKIISNCRGYSGHTEETKTFEIRVIEV